MKYGSGKYGSGKYGDTTGEVYGANLYGLCIDWDETAPRGGNEAMYMTSFRTERGRDKMIDSSGTGFAQYDVGTATFTLINRDGRYDPYNTSSPLYPNFGPGKFIQFYMTRGDPMDLYATLTRRYLFTGIIDDIQPGRDYNGERYITITASDGWKWLQDHEIYTDLYINVRLERAISESLDKVYWPWGRSISDVISGVPTYVPFWYSDGNRLSYELFKLCNSFNRELVLSADGTATLINRAGGRTFTTTAFQEDLLKDIQIQQPWEIVRNIVKVDVTTYVGLPTQVLWTLNDSTMSIAAGASAEIWLDYNYNGLPTAAGSVETPAATTDYTMNTQSDGLGSDLTASFAIELDVYAKQSRLLITNNSASLGYITLFQVRGRPLYGNTTSIRATGGEYLKKPKTFIHDAPWIQSINSAQNTSGSIINLLDGSNVMPIVFEQSLEAFGNQFLTDVGSDINTSIPALGITGNYRIGKVIHQSLENTQSILTELHLEPTMS